MPPAPKAETRAHAVAATLPILLQGSGAGPGNALRIRSRCLGPAQCLGGRLTESHASANRRVRMRDCLPHLRPALAPAHANSEAATVNHTHTRPTRAHKPRARAGWERRGAARERCRTFIEVDVALGLRDSASLRCGRPADGKQDGCNEHGSPGPSHARGPHRRPGHETSWSKRWTPGLICTRRETRPARPLRGFPWGGMQWRAGRRPLDLSPRVARQSLARAP